jgi:hypothetical protein
MALEGYVDYQRREYCKDVQCPVQLQLNALVSGSEEYMRVRETCLTGCLHTTYEFHHWLIDHAYLVVRPRD